jgi:hypothetical protein
MGTNEALQFVRTGLYILTVIASFALAMNLGTVKHKLAQWLSVVFGCWALNAALMWAILHCVTVLGRLPAWYPWAATINALFMLLAPMVIWHLFSRAMDGES